MSLYACFHSRVSVLIFFLGNYPMYRTYQAYESMSARMFPLPLTKSIQV